ncbi:MAG: erythrose-4-phosphate dehydrogenase, partial [Desulfobacula sp.]|nr:erythrose-4-phosphate dehydrogenase [Desulfobacula sp.]
YESKRFYGKFNIVAINEIADIKTIYHVTKFDSTHGRFPLEVTNGHNILKIGKDQIKVFHEQDIDKLPWEELGIDLVLECTGFYSDRQAGMHHLKSGAKKVIFSNPAADEMDATIVYGVNHQTLKKEHLIISNASCTTNCVIPVLHVIDQTLGIKSGSITTIHSAMNDQPVIDAYNSDLRKTRSALQSIIPVSTELEKGITRILPSMADKFESLAIRVPTINVSIMDIALVVEMETNVQKVNAMLTKASKNQLKNIMGVTDENLVSCDFNHDDRSSIVDLHQTRVSKNHLVKIQAWFDNEWGYSNRMLDTAIAALEAK